MRADRPCFDSDHCRRVLERKRRPYRTEDASYLNNQFRRQREGATRQDTTRRFVPDRALEGGGGHDSQADSHSVAHRRPLANVSGSYPWTFQIRRTSPDVFGRQKRGLQNRLRGAVEASWVSSILIHPRQISRS